MPPEELSKNQRPVQKSMREQLMDAYSVPKTSQGEPFSDASVEFIPAPVKDVAPETQNTMKEGLLTASHDNIELLLPATPELSHEIDTSSAKDALGEEMMEDGKIEVLSEPLESGEEFSEATRQAVQKELENDAFLPQNKSEVSAINPTEAFVNDLVEKLRHAAEKLGEQEKNSDQERLKKLGLALTDLSQRTQATIEMKNVSSEYKLSRLERLSDEIATVGTKEWEERFIMPKEETASTETPAQPEKPAAPSSEEVVNEESNIARRHTPDEPEEEASVTPQQDIVHEEMLPEVPVLEEKTSHDETPVHEEAPEKEATPAAEGEVVPASSNETEEKEITPEKKRVISADIEALFQKDFAFAQEDLKSIVTKVETPEGEKTVRFSDLSEGQQLLLLENLKSFSLDNAKEQALKGFTEDEKERFGNAGFIKKTWLGISKTYRRASEMAQIEKDILVTPEMEKGTYTEMLRDMLGLASEAPEAEWKDGKLQVNFALEKDFAGLDLKKLNRENAVREFNELSGRFAEIPMEWAYSKNENEQKKYQNAKIAYAEARGQILNLKAEGGAEDEALAYVASLDKKIHFSQLFNTHPEAGDAFAADWMKEAGVVQTLDAFEKAKNQNTKWAGWKAILGERGGLMARGMAVRTVAAAGAGSFASGFGLSALGGPLGVALFMGATVGAASGGFLGRYMARKRAKLEISDKKELAQMGVTDSTNEKDFLAAKETKIISEEKGGESQEIGVGLSDKIEYALNRVWEAEENGDSAGKEKALRALGDRLYYTEQKITENLVNYGEGAEGRKNYYELNLALAKARTLHEMNEPDMMRVVDLKIRDLTEGKSFGERKLVGEEQKIIDVKEKIDALLGETTGRIEKTEKDIIDKKGKTGLKYGLFLGGVFGAIASEVGYAAHGGSGTALSSAPEGHIPTSLPNTDPALLQKVLPNTGRLPTTLADDILNKLKFTKNYELPADAPSHPVNTGSIAHVAPVHEEVSVLQVKAPLHSTSSEYEPVEHNGPLHPEGLKDVKETVLPEPKTTAPAEHATLNTAVHKEISVPKEGVSPVHETPLPRDVAIENSLRELGKVHTVVKGDNIWNINKAQLDSNEYWKQLGATPEGVRQQNFILDTMRHKLLGYQKADLIKMGIKSGDINRIYPGDKIDLSKVFDKDELGRMFNRADELDAAPHVSSVAQEVHHTPRAVPSSEEVAHPAAPQAKDSVLEHRQTPHKEPTELVQKNDTPHQEVSSAESHIAPQSPETIVPQGGGRFEAFSMPTNTPLFQQYKTELYSILHQRRPDIGIPLYDMKMRDFLSNNPNGLETLKNIFYMKGVSTPKILSQKDLNETVLDWWVKQALQYDINNNHLRNSTSYYQPMNYPPQQPVPAPYPPQQMFAPVYEDATTRNIRESMMRANISSYQSQQAALMGAAQSQAQAQRAINESMMRAKLNQFF